jgi:hypothetical protein
MPIVKALAVALETVSLKLIRPPCFI